MSVFDLYSKRKAAAAKTGPDVYTYEVPDELRIQIEFLWREALGHDYHGSYDQSNLWKDLHDIIAKEHQVRKLGQKEWEPELAFFEYFRKVDSDKALDMIELTAEIIENYLPRIDVRSRNIKTKPQDAIEELNTRFRENAVGYQYENGRIIRVDSQYVHSEVIKEAIGLISSPVFEGANQEFMSAFAHLRSGESKDAIADALNAFESTMKTICDLKGWKFDRDKATASTLIDILFNKGLIPAELQSEFTSLASILKSGLPTVRNRKAGHGQGSTVVVVPDHLAKFAIDMCAANIVFLVRAFEEIK